MQATMSNRTGSSWFRVGAVIAVLGFAFWLAGKWSIPAEVRVAPAPVAQSAEVEPAQSASALDELLSEAELYTKNMTMPPINSSLEQRLENDWGEQIYSNGAAECVYSILDKLGLSNCKASTEKFMETCYQFYSRAHCDNRLDSGPESYSQPATNS